MLALASMASLITAVVVAAHEGGDGSRRLINTMLLPPLRLLTTSLDIHRIGTLTTVQTRLVNSHSRVVGRPPVSTTLSFLGQGPLPPVT